MMHYTEWRKSTRSGNQGNCVMVRHNDTHVQVKDSKDLAGSVLTFTHAQWEAFTAGVQAGEFVLS